MCVITWILSVLTKIATCLTFILESYFLSIHFYLKTLDLNYFWSQTVYVFIEPEPLTKRVLTLTCLCNSSFWDSLWESVWSHLLKSACSYKVSEVELENFNLFQTDSPSKMCIFKLLWVCLKLKVKVLSVVAHWGVQTLTLPWGRGELQSQPCTIPGPFDCSGCMF